MQRSAELGLTDNEPLATELTQAVRQTLAAKCRLRPEAVRMSCQPVLRAGAVCGLHFALRGPREVLLTAVWDAETGVLLCYGSRGERFSKSVVPGASGAAAAD